MGLSSTTNRVSFTGDGSSTVFAFPYYFFKNTDLAVYLYDTGSSVVYPQTLSTNYTVSGSVNSQGVYPGGGNVVMNSAFPSNLQLIVTRSPNPIQNYALVQNQPISALATVQQFDYVTALVQRVQDAVSRCIQMPDGLGTINGNAFSPILPSAINYVPNGNAPIVLNSGATGVSLGVVITGSGGTAAGFAGTLPVGNGGTGQNLVLTANGVWYSIDPQTMGQTAAGTLDQVFVGTATAPNFGQVNLASASAVKNLLPGTFGGTGLSTFIPGGVLVASSLTVASVSAPAAEGLFLMAQASSTPQFRQINLSSTAQFTGTLPVSLGGTGVGTLQPQYGIMYMSSTTQVGVVPNGTPGQFLQCNGSSAPSYVTAGNPAVNVQTVTGNFVTTNANAKIIAQSSLYTVFLYKPTAGDTGKELEVLNTDNSYQAITIQGSNSTITRAGGAVTSTTINTQGECTKFYNDGNNWFENVREIPRNVIAMGSTIITAPVGGTATPKASSVISDQSFFWREGKWACYYFEIETNSVGGAGAGNYLLQCVPAGSGLKIDNTIVRANSNASAVLCLNTAIGYVQGEAGNAGQTQGFFICHDSTNLRVTGFMGGAQNVWGSAFNGFNNASVKMGGTAKFPIIGWNG